MFTLEKQNGFADVALDFHQTIEKDHSRIETRRCWVISAPEFLAYMDPDQVWSQLQSLVMIEAKRKRAGWKADYLLKVLSQLDAVALLESLLLRKVKR